MPACKYLFFTSWYYPHNAQSLHIPIRLIPCCRLPPNDILTTIMSSSIVLIGLCLCLIIFIVIIWYHDLYQPRYVHQANVLLASFFSLFTFGIVFTGLSSVSTSMIKCSGLLTMVYFALYLNMLTEFIRILDCYIAIVFPFKHQQYITLVCHHFQKLLDYDSLRSFCRKIRLHLVFSVGSLCLVSQQYSTSPTCQGLNSLYDSWHDYSYMYIVQRCEV